MILKPNMVLPGLTCPSKRRWTRWPTPRCGVSCEPFPQPFRASLSYRRPIRRTGLGRLNAMNVRFKSRLPWALAFSFARAIQQPALELWRGEGSRVSRHNTLCIIGPSATQPLAAANTLSRWKIHELRNRYPAIHETCCMATTIGKRICNKTLTKPDKQRRENSLCYTISRNSTAMVSPLWMAMSDT